MPCDGFIGLMGDSGFAGFSMGFIYTTFPGFAASHSLY